MMLSCILSRSIGTNKYKKAGEYNNYKEIHYHYQKLRSDCVQPTWSSTLRSPLLRYPTALNGPINIFAEILVGDNYRAHQQLMAIFYCSPESDLR